MHFLKLIDKIIAKLIRSLIYLYQRTLSPDHGWGGFLGRNPGCRFYPSCSVYSRQALEQYGFIGGSIKSLKRLVRCHPWQEGGHDPLI